MKPEDKKFQEYIESLNEIRDRMIEAGLVNRHGYTDDTKVIGSEFTPDGVEVVTTIRALDEALGGLTTKQIVLFWKYMLEVAHAREKTLGGDR